MAVQSGIRTLCPQNFKKKFFTSQGFSLVEIMVVIVLMGLVTGTVLTRTAWKKNETKEFYKDLRHLSREIFLKARLKNSVYRMVFKISDLEGEENPSVLVYAEARIGEEFEKDEDKLLKSVNFPESVIYKNFLSDLKENEEESVEEVREGEGEEGEERKERFFYRYIYFLPQGYVSPVALQVEQNKRDFTFTIESLTGILKRIKGYVDLESIKEKENL